jgi:Di- and tricarboxylate transporters
MKATAQVYSSPIIYLFLGGFTMALSIERWGLHKRLALWIISKAGNSPSSLLLGFMLATALLSMWISNTATTLMLLPIALALLGEMERQGHSAANSRFPQALLLSMAYAASIGGTATLIGTPTNLIFAAASEELLGTSVSFTEWMLKAGPLCLLSFVIAWLYLSRWRYQVPRSQKSDVQALVETQLHELGAIRKEEKWVIGIFGTVVFFWIFRTLLFDSVLPGMTDAGVAIAGALCMFIVPSSEKNQRLLQWKI